MTSTTVTIETVAQVASKVAKESPDLRIAMQAAKGCDHIFGTCSTIASINARTVGIVAELLSTELQTGRLPAELTQIVDDTIAAATALKNASDQVSKFDNGCQGPETAEACKVDLTKLFVAELAMDDELNAWRPYGVS